MTTRIYHNPRCSTSRKALELLRERGVKHVVVDYLKTGWDRQTLERLAASVGGVSGLLRAKEAGAKALLDQGADDEAIIAAVIAEPILVERPIVETAKGARIGRPVETILEVL